MPVVPPADHLSQAAFVRIVYRAEPAGGAGTRNEKSEGQKTDK